MRNAIVKHNILMSMLTMLLLIVLGNQVSYGQTITASTPQPLTEAALHGSVVTLTLNGGTYGWIRDIRDAVTVTGIEGTTFDSWNVDRINNTKVTVKLTFSGNIDSDTPLVFTVGANAIEDYNGPALTAQLPVTAVEETLVASTETPLNEAILNESVVTLTLNGRTYGWIRDIRDAVTVTGIEGTTFDSWNVDRINNTKVTVELTFSGNIDSDTPLVFTVGANAIEGYNGPALTAQLPVTAVEETLVASTETPLNEAILNESVVTLTLSGRSFADRWDIEDALTVTGIEGVEVGYVDRVSDTKVTVELTFSGDIDTDATLTFTVGADAIAGYNGPALTAEVPVTGIQRSEEYILGPWLWMIAKGSSIESDQLARVSNGDITENHVAAHGVNEGDAVGVLQWTRGRIPLTTPVCKTETVDLGLITFTNESCSTDNINELVNAIGLSETRDLNDYSAYGLINIVSPRQQNDVLMGVGSDDTVKVWLNGEVVHEYTGGWITINRNTTRTGRSTTGIQDKFRTNLKAGNNLLLVKVSEYEGEWGMFFEIYLGDEDFTTSLVFSADTAPPLPTPTTLKPVSDDNQTGVPGETLANPFVVEVQDENGSPFVGGSVTFTVVAGSGTLSVTSATTDSNGRAESILTLGPNPGTNTVEVTVTGVQGKQTFTAEGVQIPKTFVIVSGDDQQEVPGTALEKPFVVEVRDQSDNPLPGVQVTFSVTSGGGRLSATTATTDSDGRAESTLTLGPNPEANTVTVSVTGIQEGQTLNAEGIRTPKAFWIISGFDQKGLIGEALPNPIIIEVRDQSGEPLPDVQVTFSVGSGGGTLSVTSATTDSDGRAESVLTLGPDPGTNTVEVTVAGIQENQTATAIAELPPIPEDVNRDDVVNILDLVLVASVLGAEGAGLAADANGDGIVNILDLVLVAGALGNAAAAPSADPRDLAMLRTADVGEWLAQAGELNLTDAMSQQGVLVLEQLLAALIPKETALLPNYPNPFNPETWIPYQLANTADVTLTIYLANGTVVRTLQLGNMPAGMYKNRSRAAYWNGKNAFGEQVASGVYFYTFTADDFTATRKMLIRK